MTIVSLIKNFGQLALIILLFASTVFLYQQNRICKVESEKTQVILQLQNAAIKKSIDEAKVQQEKLNRATREAEKMQVANIDEIIRIKNQVIPATCKKAMIFILRESQNL